MQYETRAKSFEITLIECPRDAMQGWKIWIPTATKIAYLNSLLRVGFGTLDCGSFVSAKAIPQMADTREVLEKLDTAGATKLLVIVANLRGAQEAVAVEKISYLGFPFSISPTFQLRNTNSTMQESLQRLDAIQDLCLKNNKELVVYLSMGFGNPYGDKYDEGILLHWADEMFERNVRIISLADTVGVALPEQISFALRTFIPAYPAAEFGVHLHSGIANRKEKLEAAIAAGCKRFDGALKGIGGCPMAQNDLIGNMDSEWMISYFQSHNLLHGIDQNALQKALQLAGEVFS